MPTYDEMTPAERRERKEQVDREYQEKRKASIQSEKQKEPKLVEKPVVESQKTYVDLTNPAKVSENLSHAPKTGYGSGWTNESERHSLASQGVITTAPKPFPQQSTNPNAKELSETPKGKPSPGTIAKATAIMGKLNAGVGAGLAVGKQLGVAGLEMGSSAVDFARESNLENEKVKAGLRDWESSMTADIPPSKEEISAEAWARNYTAILAYSKEVKQAVMDIRKEKEATRQSLIKQLEYNRELNAKWEDKLYAKQKSMLQMTNDDLKQESIRESCRYELAKHRMETKNSVRQHQIDITYWSEIDSRMSNHYGKLKRQLEVHKPRGYK